MSEQLEDMLPICLSNLHAYCLRRFVVGEHSITLSMSSMLRKQPACLFFRRVRMNMYSFQHLWFCRWLEHASIFGIVCIYPYTLTKNYDGFVYCVYKKIWSRNPGISPTHWGLELHTRCDILQEIVHFVGILASRGWVGWHKVSTSFNHTATTSSIPKGVGFLCCLCPSQNGDT